jgi:vacuolar-type H+-ATPase subunit H
VKANDSLDEAEALAKLKAHERALDRQLEDARQDAARILAEARAAAVRLKDVGEVELREAIERLRHEAAKDRERQLSVVHDETARRIEVLRHRVGQNRESALAWILSRVEGGETP